MIVGQNQNVNTDSVNSVRIPTTFNNFELVTKSGNFMVEIRPHDFVEATGLQLDQTLSETYFNGRLIEELIRRHHLRTFLATLLQNSPNWVSKADLVQAVWNEPYDSDNHDARIYTTVQRIRNILGQHDAILSCHGSYRWNSNIDFKLFKTTQKQTTGNQRVQTMILTALSGRVQTEKPYLSRSDLVQITQTSEATVKRELNKLLNRSQIVRHGRGRAIVYTFS